MCMVGGGKDDRIIAALDRAPMRHDEVGTFGAGAEWGRSSAPIAPRGGRRTRAPSADTVFGTLFAIMVGMALIFAVVTIMTSRRHSAWQLKTVDHTSDAAP